ncbi:MAG: molybdopterin-synthase adenylyltransferase MoeB [Acidobacteriota bacterium]|nr:molybdopterin-synthase adenylyltransferase MoeB [Acidobacteriota bacterium]
MTDRPPGGPDLTPEEIGRYSRHLTLPGVGLDGQKRLSRGSALIVGAGGLGAPAAVYLAAAGVGRIGIVEFDRVESSNLQRQVLYTTDDVGRPKLQVAIERLQAINPHVEFVGHDTRLDASNALGILSGYDVILDGTDNFPTRYLVNDACLRLDKPNVHGSIFRFEGQVSVFWAEHGPCYRCLFPEPPPAGSVPNCAEGGVLGVLPGTVGTLQATEAIKLLLGHGELLTGRLLLYDALSMQVRILELRRDPDCPGCGPGMRDRPLVDVASTCARNEPKSVDAVSVTDLARELAADGNARVLDVRTAEERQICRIPDHAWIPLDQLAGRWEELDRSAPWVVYCHTGIRSAAATGYLTEQGIHNVRNLTGGIDEWSTRIDPVVPRY